MEKFFKPNTETSRCTKSDIDRAELKDDQLIDTYNIGNVAGDKQIKNSRV